MAVNLGARSRIIWQFIHNSNVSKRIFNAADRNINPCEKCCRRFVSFVRNVQYMRAVTFLTGDDGLLSPPINRLNRIFLYNTYMGIHRKTALLFQLGPDLTR
jgi:hypothetical protein